MRERKANTRDIRYPVTMAGLSDFLLVLSSFPVACKAALRRSAILLGRLVTREAKARVPSRKKFVRVDKKRYPVVGFTGALRKSIGFKAHLAKDGVYVMVVGPRTAGKFDALAFWPRYRGAKNIITKVVPKWYAHLVEHGHQLVRFGRKTGRRVPARPYLRPAMDAGNARVLEFVRDSFEAAIEKLIIKGQITMPSESQP
ncbi:MAG: hypothetical protein EBR82_16990 [Caulobacteraceae bacterium]|nr:hypothetical protein [Caulobacteraceae bacterium]